MHTYWQIVLQIYIYFQALECDLLNINESSIKFENKSINETILDIVTVSENEIESTSISTKKSSPPLYQHNLSLNIPKISSHLYSRRKNNECWKEATCEPLEVTSCFGVPLSYNYTSLALSSLPSQHAAREIMESFTSLKNLPHCWSVVQPFLCAVLFPQCNNSLVQMPSIEMCTISRGPCRIYEKEKGWPDFLKCRPEYPPKCKTASRNLVFNTTGSCSPPLVNTSNEAQWVEGIRGCGLQCSDPLLKPEEREDLKGFIGLFGGICLSCAALTVLTYLIDWRCASKYPALIVFYVNLCFLVTCIGFVVQFYGDVRNQVICYPDGTLRNSEPSSGGNLSCVVLFVCVYYFMIAASMWFVILGYAWHRSFQSLAAGQCQQNLDRKGAYFHLISWSIPLVFSIGVIASSEVKADPAFGICFLASSVPVQVGALLVPVATSMVVGVAFLLRALKSLLKMKLECSNIISDHANKKIVETIIRLGIFVTALVAFLVITLYTRIYVLLNQDLWKKTLRDYILCTSGITSYDGNCTMNHRPSVNMYKLSLLALFGSGILMSSWCWTSNTVKAWQRFLRRVVGVTDEEPVRVVKHRVIAEAFAKRNDLNNVGRLSISLRSLHSDPVGLNFEMNSATSCDVSSVWAAAIPHLMNRRGAVTNSTAFVPRRNSVDSEYGISRRFSIESSSNRPGGHRRRHSLDSQLSFHVSDVERFSAMQTAARFGVSERRKGRRDWFSLRRKGKSRNARGSVLDRRNSTSDESNLGSMVLPTLNLSTTDSLFTSMMKRLNLSGERPSFSAQDMPSSFFNPATDSCDEDVNATLTLRPFSRKYNGFKRRDKNESLFANELTKPKIIKASVAIQTSLDSLVIRQTSTEEKACQVNSPELKRCHNPIGVRKTTSNTTTTTSTSPCGSITSSSERITKPAKDKTSTMKDSDAFFNGQIRNSFSFGRSSKPSGISSSGKRQFKKRSQSENETSHTVVDLE